MEQSISEKISNAIKTGQSLDLDLGKGKKLKLERRLPFLLVYRFSDEKGKMFAELVTGEASYLTASTYLNAKSEIVRLILSSSKSISEEFRAVMIMEIWVNPNEPKMFTINSGKNKSPETVETILKGLQGYSESHGLEVKVNYTPQRHPPNLFPLLTLEQCREAGIYLIGLEIPGFFLNPDKGEFYPLVYEDFKRFFSKLIRKSVYDFLRVQTTFGIKHYQMLGTTNISKHAWDVEKQLSQVQKKYQFLLLISPVNTIEAKQSFIENKYLLKPKFIYRLLPVDPDRLKEKLFQISISEVEDPTLRFLFMDKREELEKQITMLKERGTKNFMHTSIRLYNAVDHSLYNQAKSLLQEIPPENESQEPLADCRDLLEASKREISLYQQTNSSINPKIIIKDDIVGMLVSQGNLYIGKSFKVPKKQLQAMVHHEIGTHVLTYFNGIHQPFTQLSSGFADYDELQEGLAVFSEYLCGGLSANRLRILAARVIAAHCLTEGYDFPSTFRVLFETYRLDEKTAFEITARIHQSGGCTKDIIYLRGLISLLEYLKEGGDLEILYVGKIALKHISLVQEMKLRGIIRPPALIPRYLSTEEGKQRLAVARQGIKLKNLIMNKP
ncbi:flavohemoglobin expression-modulating QEGLA motif protein [Belliella marina]|uniref:Flavohemoglobin expression-modulating QEGLA motif protein n=1 Tax=Belliella marina TaxID=1644146 RepID=A0ABW4VRA5_9BACT